jgi:tRNA1(Val) A37 N6-methylase TrmN6
MSSAVTRDAFLGGRLTLVQPASGHRAGTDAVLLAAAVAETASGLLYDFGSGVGAAGLGAAARAKELGVRLVEIDPEVAELARQTIEASGLGGRASVVEADIAGLPGPFPAGVADIVLMNPPFHRPGTTRPSPSAYRRQAHEAAAGVEETWLRRAARVLRPGGSVVLVHRADALPRCLSAMDGRFGDLILRPVQPRPAEPATRILLRGAKGSRAPLRILPPLVLHEPDGRFTPQAAALHEGQAGLDWA